MSRDVEFMANVINERLGGATITGAAISKDKESFGFCATRDDGTKVVVWVDCDAEGNGPGWLSVEITE